MTKAAKYMRIYVWIRLLINLLGITSFAWDILLVAAVHLFTSYKDFHKIFQANKNMTYFFSQAIWRGYVDLTGVAMLIRLLQSGQLSWQASDIIYNFGGIILLSLICTGITYIAVRRGDI
ncbi:hypothetical protein AWM75_04355 [Aerococcus urinaehominis]|uniref:Uncharacterized protein n=1 Tax=Aerococcus urinaehominis TaxID=128944 RepID=A0A109RGV3_9LACT|nr:hypothetical protein [Aerococcus urinaehominis]AMB99279.1 hypothetical protein AWM75_04355 [Aerococcus urinaehominis]SDM47660.1 hypothetical protein SAMN04487985_11840 [Aerococcus urinaehominis]